MDIGAKIDNLKQRAVRFWQYSTVEIWNDRSNSLKSKVLKTINLSVRSFMSSDIQSQACAMTYRTLLAMVPALALIFALGRGFGLQDIIERELLTIFHAQREAISRMMNFVDSYLNQASEGIFVGIGIIFLLWTLISLVSNIEQVFNIIWGVKNGRSLWRKVTDYTAMLLILPVILICVAGLNVLLSSTLDAIFNFEFLTPVITVILELASWLLTWLFFTAVFMLIPNVKVRFLNAFIAGIIAGSAFIFLQWIFVSGQMYVAKYNAIYGSVSFFPLLLIWMQLTWVIILAGAVLCYASQNIFEFDFKEDVERISMRYREKVMMAVATIIIKRFVKAGPPVTEREIIVGYRLPPQLVGAAIETLIEAGIISRVVVNEKKETLGYQPAIDPSMITVSFFRHKIEVSGRYGFIPSFDKMFPGVIDVFDRFSALLAGELGNTRLSDLRIENLTDSPDRKHRRHRRIKNDTNSK